VGFEPTIPLFERAKTVLVLDRAATVIGILNINFGNNFHTIMRITDMHCCIHKNPSLKTTLSRLNPVHTFISKVTNYHNIRIRPCHFHIFGLGIHRYVVIDKETWKQIRDARATDNSTLFIWSRNLCFYEIRRLNTTNRCYRSHKCPEV
jgi:hypothetical protein